MAEQGTVGSMPVTAFLGENVKTIPPDSSVLDVVAALADADVGLLALGEGKQIAGVVSERDVVRALAKGMEPATAHAIDIASTKLVWCDASASVADVATEMLEHYVRHVLVEEDGHLVGMVSARDLLGAYASADAEEDEEAP